MTDTAKQARGHLGSRDSQAYANSFSHVTSPTAYLGRMKVLSLLISAFGLPPALL